MSSSSVTRSLDFKDYYQTGARNHVPPLVVETPFLYTASDPTYAAVHGDDLLPDVAIGRLPAADGDEVHVLVRKIVIYETAKTSLRGPVVLVTDNADRGGNFDSNAASLERGVLAGIRTHRISLSKLGVTSAKQEVLDAFDEGVSLVSYMGHGGIHLWASENLLNTADIASLAPQSRQPLVLAVDCLNGYFHFPFLNSLSEELVKANGKRGRRRLRLKRTQSQRRRAPLP